METGTQCPPKQVASTSASPSSLAPVTVEVSFRREFVKKALRVPSSWMGVQLLLFVMPRRSSKSRGSSFGRGW